MRLYLNTGQTSTVKVGLVLGGDTVGLPKSPLRPKVNPRDTQRIPKGYPTDTQGKSNGATP